MEYVPLGRSTLRISRIGFGCMSLKPGTADNETILHKAVEAGINYFDTADLYDKGANEEMLGKALKQKRNDIILATKAGNQWRSDGSGWDWNPRKEYILRAAEASLKRLQTDHIDLYQLHGGTIDDPIDESIEAFEQLVKEGKILYYGISSIRPNVIRYWVEHSGMSSVMMQYSLLDRRPEEECLELLHKNRIGVLARGSIAQGLLIDKKAKDYQGYTAEEVESVAHAVRSLSNDIRSASQIAIQFVLQHAAVSAAVVGIRTIRQLEEAISSANSILSTSEVEFLQYLLPVNRYQDHR
jgi:aryl-alcohol dehydrogenase-like predicted oxidoreductase